MKSPVLFLVLLVAVIAVSGCISQQPEQPAQPSSENDVTIKDYAFSPQTLTVKKGAAVTWTNLDSVPHQAASDPHPAHTDLPSLVSGDLGKGQKYSFTFEKTGTFGYHCHIHPYMKGTIVVEE